MGKLTGWIIGGWLAAGLFLPVSASALSMGARCDDTISAGRSNLRGIAPLRLSRLETARASRSPSSHRSSDMDRRLPARSIHSRRTLSSNSGQRDAQYETPIRTSYRHHGEQWQRYAKPAPHRDRHWGVRPGWVEHLAQRHEQRRELRMKTRQARMARLFQSRPAHVTGRQVGPWVMIPPQQSAPPFFAQGPYANNIPAPRVTENTESTAAP